MDSVSKRLHRLHVNKTLPDSSTQTSDFAIELQQRQKKYVWIQTMRKENEEKADYKRYSLEYILRRRYDGNEESCVWERDMLKKAMQAEADKGKSSYNFVISGPHHEKTWKTVKEHDLFGRAANFLLQHVFFTQEMRIRCINNFTNTDNTDIFMEISWNVFDESALISDEIIWPSSDSKTDLQVMELSHPSSNQSSFACTEPLVPELWPPPAFSHLEVKEPLETFLPITSTPKKESWKRYSIHLETDNEF